MTDVIKGTYADLKHIKTRGMWQVCIEIPEAEFNNIVGLLGSPQHGKDVWVAIARLTTEAAQEKPKKHFDEKSKSQQAYLICSRDDFQKFLSVAYPKSYRAAYDTVKEDMHGSSSSELAFAITDLVVKKMLCIFSKSELDDNAQLAANWDALVTEYRQATGQIAEAR